MFPLGRAQLKFAAVGTLLAISRQLAEADKDSTQAKTDLSTIKLAKATTDDRKKAVIDETLRLFERLISERQNLGGLGKA